MSKPTNSSDRLIPRLNFKLRLSLLLSWAATILTLSLISSPPQMPGVLGWDKLMHASAYAMFALLLALVLLRCPWQLKRPWLSAWLGTVCFGATLEILQLCMQNGRTAEWWDLVADAIGALLVCVIFRHGRGVLLGRRVKGDTQHG